MHRPPAAVTEEIRKLPEQLLSSSRANDPPPLPCEDQGGAASAPWPLAVEDAQASAHACLSVAVQCVGAPACVYVCVWSGGGGGPPLLLHGVSVHLLMKTTCNILVCLYRFHV